MLRRIIERGEKALIVLPYVSVVTEKASDLQAKVGTIGLCVRAYHTNVSDAGMVLPSEVDIAVCTIEKVRSFSCAAKFPSFVLGFPLFHWV